MPYQEARLNYQVTLSKCRRRGRRPRFGLTGQAIFGSICERVRIPYVVNTSGPTTTQNVQSPGDTVAMEVAREVRFAVVMYGGVSLAIYINGVAQELLNMARATAPKTVDDGEALLRADPKQLTGSLAVYRKLGQFLHQRAELAEAAKLDAGGKPKPPSTAPIRTRFVVDVISGTSAGGINGVFLAKALARNQGMGGLKRLWLTEGDLGKLLNDKFSISDLAGFELKEPQASLLNSQRMYRKLLEALDQMDERRENATSEKTDSPLVAELDLFITTTDIEGIPLPIVLSDNIVYERRYKNVFHFRYATENATGSKRDDFIKANDPFLAFAARCTSSFPFAFEAMCLSDIDDVTKGYQCYEDTPTEQDETWDAFFSEYMRLGLLDLDTQAREGTAPGLTEDPHLEKKLAAAKLKLRKAFRSRAFGDGGYLDNKPFSYATAMLMRRRSDCVVHRKLLYVEPSPEHPELIPDKRNRPDFAANIRAAVLDLPRQETIREDIERLNERNEMLERVASFARHVDADLAAKNKQEQKNRNDGQQKEEEKKTKFDFAKEDLAKMIEIYGISYGVYHRLKVEETTGLLAGLIARAAGHDPSSAAGGAVRELVEAWRRKNFSALKDSEKPETENAFLKRFDIRYVLRRFIFLNRRVNQLAPLDEEAETLLKTWLDQDPNAPELDVEHRPEGWDDDFRNELNLTKKYKFSHAVTNARSAEEKLLNPRSDTGALLYQAMSQLDMAWPRLQEILQCDSAAARRKKADEILNEPGRKRAEALNEVARVIWRGFADAPVAEVKENVVNENAGAKAARACLDYFERNFFYYDLVTYPVQYGTGVGETNAVEVFRVSPEDATALIDERRQGRSKLAGRFLMSFGAFLDEGWRKNDMLWGRLDGAERIISSLLPDQKDDEVRKNLIKEAHMAILDEEIKAGDIKTICDLVGGTLAGHQPLTDDQLHLREFVQRAINEQDLTKALQSALYRCLDQPQKIWEYYGSHFQVDRKLNAEAAVRLISRATNVTGRMLEALAQDYRIDPARRAAGWIVRLASVFWNIIGVAVPGSIRNLLLRHWLGLIYVFEFFLIVAGIVFSSSQIKGFGWQALGVTVAFNIAVALLGYYISNERFRLRIVRSILAAVLVALVVFGAIHIVDYFTHLSKARELVLVAIVALPLWIIVGWVEWRKWSRQLWSHFPKLSKIRPRVSKVQQRS
jgi:patatin-related protein